MEQDCTVSHPATLALSSDIKQSQEVGAVSCVANKL